MTYAPADLLAVIRYLRDHGAPADALGIVGDAAHAASGGYHEGHDDLAAHGRLGYDYSVVESRRDTRPTDAASAVDFAGTSWWRPLTLWLVDQCKAGTPGTEDIREIIYTPDGQTVRRWDRLGVRSSGDDSHLWHTHLSFFRDSEGHRGTFLALLRSYFEPALTSAAVPVFEETTMIEKDVKPGFGIDHTGKRIKGGPLTVAGIDDVNAGTAGNGLAWAYVFLDPIDMDAKAGDEAWFRVIGGNGATWGGDKIMKLGPGHCRDYLRLDTNDRGVSVIRLERFEGDPLGDYPASVGVNYGQPIKS